jgi:hypothetical protein
MVSRAFFDYHGRVTAAAERENAMSARDLFVTDEELEARAREALAGWTDERNINAAEPGLPEETKPGYTGQFGEEETTRHFHLRRILPALFMGLVLVFAVATSGSGSGSAREGASSIPSPCRG